MSEAVVGDDVFGEDPTIHKLQEIACNLMQKEAALFVPTGTMGNLISVMVHCGRGDEALLGDKSHIHIYEQGGIAQIGGVHPRTVTNNPDGTLDLDDLVSKLRVDNPHFPISRLVCVENTHNKC